MQRASPMLGTWSSLFWGSECANEILFKSIDY